MIIMTIKIKEEIAENLKAVCMEINSQVKGLKATENEIQVSKDFKKKLQLDNKITFENKTEKDIDVLLKNFIDKILK